MLAQPKKHVVLDKVVSIPKQILPIAEGVKILLALPGGIAVLVCAKNYLEMIV